MKDIVGTTERSDLEKALAIVKASYAAYVDKDGAALEKILADDFHFTSPLDNRLDRKTYFTRCWPNSERLRDFEFVHLASRDGETVFVTYIATNVDGGRFRNTEVMTLRDGKIKEVEVYFGWSIPHEAKPGGFIDPSPEAALAGRGIAFENYSRYYHKFSPSPACGRRWREAPDEGVPLCRRFRHILQARLAAKVFCFCSIREAVACWTNTLIRPVGHLLPQAGEGG